MKKKNKKNTDKASKLAIIKANAAKVKEGHVECRKRTSLAWAMMRTYSIAGHDKALVEAKKLGFTLATADGKKFDKLDKESRASMLKALRREAK